MGMTEGQGRSRQASPSVCLLCGRRNTSIGGGSQRCCPLDSKSCSRHLVGETCCKSPPSFSGRGTGIAWMEAR